MSDRLPRLRGDYESEELVTCDGHSCEGCQLIDICNESRCKPDGVQRNCHLDCNDCGGGPQYQGTGANVPAICCKSPLKDVYLDKVRKEHYQFKKRPLLTFEQKHIVMHHGLFGGADVDLYPAGTEVAGVNLKHVWTTRGWHSRDMKDYLHIPSGTKLILLSCTYDDILERAWENEVHREDFAALGFDAWEIYELSIYPFYSNFYNLWNAFRTFYAGEASESWFMREPPFVVSVEKEGAYRHWAEWSAAVPQMTVNWQFIPIREEAAWKHAVAELRRALRRIPGVKALWFQGVASGPQIYNLRRVFSDYDCYFISSSPWMRAQQRKEFTATGGYAVSSADRLELLLQNQINYANLVQRAVEMAEKDITLQRKEKRHGKGSRSRGGGPQSAR